MPSSTMWISVVQTTAIQIAGLVLFQHFQGTMLDHFTNDPAFSDLLSAFANKSSHFNATHHSIANTTSGPISLPTGSHSLAKEGDNYGFSFTISDAANATAANQTFSALRDNPVSFYREILPMEIISFLVLSIFQYCWLIGLERAFPARPRRTNVLVDEKVGVDDPREEEIVKTWIARGRVRRVSLSWCNTWLKWVLNLTIGRLGLTALSCILRKSLHLVEITEESQDDIIKVSFVSMCRRCAKLIETVGGCASVCVFLSIHRRDSGASRIYCDSRVQADSLFGGCGFGVPYLRGDCSECG